MMERKQSKLERLIDERNRLLLLSLHYTEPYYLTHKTQSEEELKKMIHKRIDELGEEIDSITEKCNI